MSWLIDPDPERAAGLAETGTDLKKAMRWPSSSLTGAAWSSVLTNRQRVLLHTQPLILLQHFPGSRDEDQQHYDALCLAVKVFDVIIEQSGFGSEVVRDTIAESLRPLLIALDEEADVAPDTVRHDRVVDRVLSALKNDQQRGQPFEVEYQEFDDQGKPRRRRLSFRLVKEAHGYTGQIVLKLSSEAINLFLNAFGLDIEDAQAANEAVVQSQLARGKFNEATLPNVIRLRNSRIDRRTGKRLVELDEPSDSDSDSCGRVEAVRIAFARNGGDSDRGSSDGENHESV